MKPTTMTQVTVDGVMQGNGGESGAITERSYIHLFDRRRTDEAARQAMASAKQ